MRYIVIVVALLIVASGPTFADTISLALGYGVFMPTASATKDAFDDTWTRFSLISFEPTKPAEWRFVVEGGSYKVDGPIEVRLLPLAVGYERGLGEDGSARPYVALKAGPYYGSFEDHVLGTDESKIGLNANAALGVIFSRRFYVEARYDYFSELGGFDFSGFSISGGVRILDFSL